MYFRAREKIFALKFAFQFLVVSLEGWDDKLDIGMGKILKYFYFENSKRI